MLSDQRPNASAKVSIKHACGHEIIGTIHFPKDKPQEKQKLVACLSQELCSVCEILGN